MQCNWSTKKRLRYWSLLDAVNIIDGLYCLPCINQSQLGLGWGNPEDLSCLFYPGRAFEQELVWVEILLSRMMNILFISTGIDWYLYLYILFPFSCISHMKLWQKIRGSTIQYLQNVYSNLAVAFKYVNKLTVPWHWLLCLVWGGGGGGTRDNTT